MFRLKKVAVLAPKVALVGNINGNKTALRESCAKKEHPRQQEFTYKRDLYFFVFQG
jgi:hypothetical protein